MMLISESGLYTLVMRSNKPEAKVFRKWVSAEFRRDAKILDLNGVGVVTETRNLVSVGTCRIFRQVRLEGNRGVSPKFRGDAKILDLRANSVVKYSFITAVDCEIPQSPFSSGISNRGWRGLFPSRFCFTPFLEDL